MSWEPLLREAEPELYLKNAFRVANLPVDISFGRAKDRMEEIRLRMKYGAQVPHPGPGLTSAELDERLQHAQNRLSDPVKRFIDEMFWIWPLQWGCDGQPVPEEPADWEQRVELWKTLASTNYAAQHNLAVYAHAKALEEELRPQNSPSESNEDRNQLWETAWRYWKQTLENPGFWRRIEERATRHKISVPQGQDFQRAFLMALILTGARLELRQAEKDLSSHRGHPWREHFCQQMIRESGQKDFYRQILQEAIERAIEGVVQTVQAFCENAQAHASADPLQACQIAQALLQDVLPKYALVRNLVTRESTILQLAYKLATAVCRCLVVYAKKTEEWYDCIEVLNVLKEQIPAELLPKDVEDLLEGLRERIKKGDRWCGPGYWQLPADVVNVLEKARQDMEVGNWQEAIQALRPLSSSKDIAVQTAGRFALAECLRDQTVACVNRMVDEINSTSNILLQVAAERRLQERLPEFLHKLKEARQWNPLNRLIERNLDQLEKLAQKAGVSLPESTQDVYVVWEAPSPSGEGECWFCGHHQGKSSSNVLMEMAGNVQKIPSRWGNRHECFLVQIPIPRCPFCQKAHQDIQAQVALGATAWALLPGALSGLAVFGSTGDVATAVLGGFLGFLVCFGVVGEIFSLRARKLLRKLGIKPLSEANHHPLVEEKRKQGWKEEGPLWINKALRVPERFKKELE